MCAVAAPDNGAKIHSAKRTKSFRIKMTIGEKIGDLVMRKNRLGIGKKHPPILVAVKNPVEIKTIIKPIDKGA